MSDGAGSPQVENWRSPGVALGLLLLLFWVPYGWVQPTNFWGFDEWLHASLLRDGTVGFPYAHRPLMIVWSLPTLWLPGLGWRAFWLVQGTYLSVSGCLTFLILRTIRPDSTVVAFLAGALAFTWAPTDLFRIASVAMMTYAGSMFSSLLASSLLVLFLLGGSRLLLAGATLVGVVTVLSFEGTVPFLLAAPLLVLLREGVDRRRLLLTLPGWAAALGGSVLLLQGGALLGGASGYQAQLGVDLRPLPLVLRLIEQFRLHVAPIVPGAGLAEWAVPAVPCVLGVAWLAARHLGDHALPAARTCARLALAGLALAAAAYLPLVALASVQDARRTQFLSSVGIGLALAAGLGFVAALLPPRWSRLVMAGGAAWILGTGTARTMALQETWNAISRFEDQRSFLRQLRGVAPAFQDGTLVVVLDESGSLRSSFTVRHAVEYVYGRQATALLWPGRDPLYPSFLTDAGIVCEPLAAIREAWRSPASQHPFEAVVVVRFSGALQLEVLDRWPAELGTEAGERYQPRRRIVAGPRHPTPLLDR